MATSTSSGSATKPASAEDVSARASAQISYEDLYKRWEHGQWQATAIDFSEDRKGWEALEEIQRSSALWIYSMFFYGEDAVTDGLSPYIDAAPKEEQKYFLATQQVDEARHSVFFHRFFKEVIGAGDTLSAGLAFTEQYLNWGYRGVFGRLETMADELRRDRSLPKFAQAIALYHLVIEASMAQPGQHYIEDYFTKAGSMPGFSEGMHNVSRDEQRHIGFGVKVLSELLRRVGRVQGGGRRADARGAAATSPRSSCRRTGTSATRPPTASPSRTSTRSGCARSRQSGARSATRSTRCPPASTRSIPRCRTASAPSGRSSC